MQAIENAWGALIISETTNHYNLYCCFKHSFSNCVTIMRKLVLSLNLERKSRSHKKTSTCLTPL